MASIVVSAETVPRRLLWSLRRPRASRAREIQVGERRERRARAWTCRTARNCQFQDAVLEELKEVVRLAVAVDDMGRVHMSQRVQHLVMDRGKSPLGDLDRRLGAVREDTAGGPRADP